MTSAIRHGEVRLGSEAKNSLRANVVRFTPNSDQIADIAEGPSRAIFGLMHRSRLHSYSITSSAVLRSDGGTVMPSTLVVLRLIVSWYFVGC